jgi:hypothetical protein
MQHLISAPEPRSPMPARDITVPDDWSLEFRDLPQLPMETPTPQDREFARNNVW